MAELKLLTTPLLDWGASRRAKAGEQSCGDAYCLRPISRGMLLAVIDGLGHGEEAAEAAATAAATIDAHAEESVIAILRQCHFALRETRGAVLGLAAFDSADDTLTWAGIGNVEGVLFRADPAARPARDHMFSHAGTVGFMVTAMRALVIPVTRGDTLIMTTDGIRSDFADRLVMALDDAPQRLADHIMSICGKDSDDALALVARYKGKAR